MDENRTALLDFAIASIKSAKLFGRGVCTDPCCWSPSHERYYQESKSAYREEQEFAITQLSDEDVTHYRWLSLQIEEQKLNHAHDRETAFPIDGFYFKDEGIILSKKHVAQHAFDILHSTKISHKFGIFLREEPEQHTLTSQHH